MDEAWPKEEIPENAELFCRVHKNFISYRTKKPKESAFYNTPKDGDNLSSDWSKYSTPEESRERIGLQYKYNKTEFKNSNDFFIVGFIVKTILNIKETEKVEHDPLQNIPEIVGTPNNRSHSIIIGDKNDEEARLKYVDACTWKIAPE